MSLITFCLNKCKNFRSFFNKYNHIFSLFALIIFFVFKVALPSPERLRARFNEYGAVAYVERRDDRSGFIRFNNQSGAQKSIEKESFFTLELLTGTQEDNYWEYLLAQVWDKNGKFQVQFFIKKLKKIRGRKNELLSG